MHRNDVKKKSRFWYRIIYLRLNLHRFVIKISDMLHLRDFALHSFATHYSPLVANDSLKKIPNVNPKSYFL